MKKARTFLIIGIWVAILPYLGFPYSWKQTLFALTGLLIMYIAYFMYKKAKAEESPIQSKPETFSENKNVRI